LRSIPLISPEHVAGEIVALYPHARYMSAKVRTFIDALVDRIAEERPVV
jgi:DNA-binding transcriptional LysR family regulator